MKTANCAAFLFVISLLLPACSIEQASDSEASAPGDSDQPAVEILPDQSSVEVQIVPTRKQCYQIRDKALCQGRFECEWGTSQGIVACYLRGS